MVLSSTICHREDRMMIVAPACTGQGRPSATETPDRSAASSRLGSNCSYDMCGSSRGKDPGSFEPPRGWFKTRNVLRGTSVAMGGSGIHKRTHV